MQNQTSEHEKRISCLCELCVFYVIKNDKKPSPLSHELDKTESEDDRTNIIPLMLVFLLINLAGLLLSGNFIVSSLVEGANCLDISSAKLAACLLGIFGSISLFYVCYYECDNER